MRRKDILRQKLAQQRAKFRQLRESYDRLAAEVDGIRRSEQRLLSIFEFAPDGYYLNDLKGKFVDGNRTAAAMLGYQKEELIGRNFLKARILAGNQLAKAASILSKNVLGRATGPDEFELIRKDGSSLFVEIRTQPVEIGGHKLVLGVARDITERKQAQAELDSYSRDLERQVAERTRKLSEANRELKQEIRERQEHERALRESEEKYRDLVERADIGILIDDAAGNFKYYNQTFADFFGYSMQEMADLNIAGLIHPSHVRKVLQYHRERLRGLRTRSVYDFHGIRKDGSSIYVEVDVAPVRENGRIVGTRSYIWDITQRKKAELALQKSEKRNRELYNNIREAVFIFDQQGKIQEWNPQFSKILGYTEEALRQRTWQDITANEYIKTGEKIIRTQVLEQSYSDLYETVFISQSGLKIPVEARMYLIRDDDNKPAGYWVFFRDLSAQKKIEQEVYMLAQTVKSVREFVCVTDLEDRILFVNDALLETYGYKREELIGKHITILRAERNEPEVLAKLQSQSRKNGWEGELLNRKKDGTEFPIFLSTSMILDPAGSPLALVGVSSDVSERKRIEAQLRQAQKMEAVGQLAGGIAHDFNNILTAINGYAELALLKMEPKNPLFKELTGILKAGKRAGSLVRQLLAFSRKQMVELHIVNVNQLIVDLDKMLHRLIGEDIHVEMNLNPRIRKIKADPGQIEQILVNLVVNARDAVNMQTDTAGEKKITIETGNVVLDRQFILNHPGSQAGGHVCMSVSDTGIGMDENTKSKIFEPFFTTKDKIQGTGLGLATVYGIVKQNNGSIYVYSEPQQGTTIRVYWPGVEEPESVPRAADARADVEKGRETLLYVEDNHDVRGFTVAALKMMGYQVYQASNGREALEILKKNHKKVDLLITDVIMPEMGGRELVEQIKQAGSDIMVLFTSGYTDTHIVHSGTLDQGIQFLHKPYSIEALSKKIREVLAGGE